MAKEKVLVYEMYPIAWDSLKEMTEHLPRVKRLHADYVWLAPVYPSPRHDHGYDISDYRAIDPRFGSMADFDEFVRTAHDLGLKVLMDLVLNHTSTEHPWFKDRPKYYCWSDRIRPGWMNLFDEDTVWRYDEERSKYYLHLFNEKQADLNWFTAGKLNQTLVREFQEIVDFWTTQHQVDGFRLDIPQAINKDLGTDTFDKETLFSRDYDVKVINAVFEGREDLFLIMEVYDPTLGNLSRYYTQNAPVDFVMNIELPRAYASRGANSFQELLADPSLMVALESHDTPRFTSVSNLGAKSIIHLMASSANAICLYQGQELGLKNPSRGELSDEDIVELDAEARSHFINGESLDEIRPTSRANARVHIPLDEYRRQERDIDSVLHYAQINLRYWKNCKH